MVDACDEESVNGNKSVEHADEDDVQYSNGDDFSSDLQTENSLQELFERLYQLDSTVSDVGGELLKSELSGDARKELSVLVEEFLELISTVDELEGRIDSTMEQLEKEREEFSSYKEQRESRLEQEKNKRARELFTGIVDIHSDMYRGLRGDYGTVSDIEDSFNVIYQDLGEKLRLNGVEVIVPDADSEVDTEKHEVLAECTSDSVSEDNIVRVHTPGYEFNGEVIRKASVVVCSN